MNAKEFRIGNKVDLFGSTATIQKSDFAGVGIAIDSGKPIPLTESILLKCGFVKNILKANHNDIIFIGDHFAIKGMLGIVKPSECKHLHQLQNLYFALTGEELNIEL